jgi:hypothetical protein
MQYTWRLKPAKKLKLGFNALQKLKNSYNYRVNIYPIIPAFKCVVGKIPLKKAHV